MYKGHLVFVRLPEMAITQKTLIYAWVHVWHRYTLFSDLKFATPLMPSELRAKDWECLAFPQNTLMDRFWVAIYMVVILFPIQFVYTLGFQYVGNARYAKSPDFLVENPEMVNKKMKAVSAQNKQTIQVTPLVNDTLGCRGLVLKY